MRDELGISQETRARPIQAAFASATSFAIGAALPLAVTALTPERILTPVVGGTSLVCLAVLGAVAARAGGASIRVAAIRGFPLERSRHGTSRLRWARCSAVSA
jgi:VIT1/CCC1 family predicted Fe2+/Mn2+ transporter